jgi:AraC family transcriptional regulator
VRYLRALIIDSERKRGRSRGTLTPAKIDQLRHHVNASLGKPLTVQRLSALVGMSPQSFAPAFKLAFKTTPAQYVLAERVKWGRWLLESTDAKISAVAAETGFASQSHLTSVLKRLTGETPRELRRLSRR